MSSSSPGPMRTVGPTSVGFPFRGPEAATLAEPDALADVEEGEVGPCEYGSVWLLAGCCAAESVGIKLKSKHVQKRRHPIFQVFIYLYSCLDCGFTDAHLKS